MTAPAPTYQRGETLGPIRRGTARAGVLQRRPAAAVSAWAWVDEWAVWCDPAVPAEARRRALARVLNGGSPKPTT